jgi:hypothetical protein
VAWGTLGWPHGDCAGPGVPCPVYQPAGERPRMPDRRWVKCGEELLTLCRRKKTDLYFSISSARATAGQRRWRRHLAYRVRHRLTFGFSSPESPHKRDLSPRSSLAAAGCAPAVIDRAERDQRTTHDPPRMDRASGRPHLPLAPVAMPAGNRVAGSRDDVRKCEPAYRALPSSEATGVGMAEGLEQSWVRYRYAFISYASQDRTEVLKRVQMLDRTGVDYFLGGQLKTGHWSTVQNRPPRVGGRDQ